jgi:hypothetical protein
MSASLLNSHFLLCEQIVLASFMNFNLMEHESHVHSILGMLCRFWWRVAPPPGRPGRGSSYCSKWKLLLSRYHQKGPLVIAAAACRWLLVLAKDGTCVNFKCCQVLVKFETIYSVFLERQTKWLLHMHSWSAKQTGECRRRPRFD